MIAGRFTARMPLSANGFSTQDTKYFDTEDEIIECGSCANQFGFDAIVDEEG